jgi:hypothetical protein
MFFSGSTVHPGQVRRELVSIVDVLPLCEVVGHRCQLACRGAAWPLLVGRKAPAEEFDSVYAESGFGGLTYGTDERPALHLRTRVPRSMS